jgi:hypothetical protein
MAMRMCIACADCEESGEREKKSGDRHGKRGIFPLSFTIRAFGEYLVTGATGTFVTRRFVSSR